MQIGAVAQEWGKWVDVKSTAYFEERVIYETYFLCKCHSVWTLTSTWFSWGK